jgi:hypothetical protein
MQLAATQGLSCPMQVLKQFQTGETVHLEMYQLITFSNSSFVAAFLRSVITKCGHKEAF